MLIPNNTVLVLQILMNLIIRVIRHQPICQLLHVIIVLGEFNINLVNRVVGSLFSDDAVIDRKCQGLIQEVQLSKFKISISNDGMEITSELHSYSMRCIFTCRVGRPLRTSL